MKNLGLCVWIALTVAAGAVRAQESEPPFAVRAKAYVAPDGRMVEPAVMIVEDGKIKAVGSDIEVTEGLYVLERREAVLCPGLIDVDAELGTMGRSGEAAHSIEPHADALDLLNRFHRDFEAAAQAGVTTVLLAPAASHLVGGRTVAVKTAGKSLTRRVIGPGPLKLSLAAAAFTLERPPTSIQGGLDELRRQIARARSERTDKSHFAAWALGETAALIDVSGGGAELTHLARFAAQNDVRCIPLHANHAAERAADAKSLETPLVLGPFDLDTGLRFLRAPAMIEAEGMTVCFTSGAPAKSPHVLRVSASLARSHGLSPEAALAAVTTVPARIAGVADRVGSLEPGKDADFVVLSGHPLDLSSAVLEVFVNGRRVHRQTSRGAAP